jgi:DnaK suppressor protein
MYKAGRSSPRCSNVAPLPCQGQRQASGDVQSTRNLSATAAMFTQLTATAREILTWKDGGIKAAHHQAAVAETYAKARDICEGTMSNTNDRRLQRAKAKPMKIEASISEIRLPDDYRPSEDEPFMNERQRAYFRRKLLAWKEEIMLQTRETLQGLHEDSNQHADLADRATSETDRALELRARDRQRKLVSKIDAALARIEDGTYGYCEETGEPIGLRRLDARPIATLSLEAQERHERRERVYRED